MNKAGASGDFRQVETACANVRFDLAVIGDTFNPQVRKAIVLLVQTTCRDIPVLDMGKDQPVNEKAGEASQASPDQIIKAVKSILAEV